MELVSNNGETTQLGGVTGRGFKPGQSGNPSGRPKGIAKAVREACGGDPTMLVKGLLAIAAGEGAGGKPARAADQALSRGSPGILVEGQAALPDGYASSWARMARRLLSSCMP